MFVTSLVHFAQLLALAVAVGLCHLLLKPLHDLAQGEGDEQVDDGDDGQGLQGQVGGTPDDLVGGHDVAQEEGGGQGGLLQHHDKLVAESREDVADGLGQDDLHHGLLFAEAQASGGFCLALVHGLDAGTDHFGDVSTGVDA